MTDQSLQFPRFFLTAPTPCPYLPDQEERKVFTELNGEDAGSLSEALSRVGFRRSQSVAYRPACETCSSCISVRVLATEFLPNRNQRRIIRANKAIATRVAPAVATDEQYDLLNRYLSIRHKEGGMAEMGPSEYQDMVENTPVDTVIVEYRDRNDPADGDGRLVGATLTDLMPDGLSMVYSFFDPELNHLSLGTWMIIDHIRRTVENKLPHVYLGYWIQESRKMAYKARFRPLERLGPDGWFEFEPEPNS